MMHEYIPEMRAATRRLLARLEEQSPLVLDSELDEAIADAGTVYWHLHKIYEQRWPTVEAPLPIPR